MNIPKNKEKEILPAPCALHCWVSRRFYEATSTKHGTSLGSTVTSDQKENIKVSGSDLKQKPTCSRNNLKVQSFKNTPKDRKYSLWRKKIVKQSGNKFKKQHCIQNFSIVLLNKRIQGHCR